MRIFTTIFCILLSLSVKMAASSPDSCYVYKMAQWHPSLKTPKGGVIWERVGDEQNVRTLTNSKGEELQFVSIMTALNYLSMDGWELVEMKLNKPDLNYSGLAHVFLLRKKMSREEALKYSTPLDPY